MKQLMRIVFLVTVFLFELGGAQTKRLTMSGIVTDKHSHPLTGARVTMIGDKANSDATTDSEGKFVIALARGVEPGDTVRIRIEKSGYMPYDKLLPVSSEIPLPVSLEPIKGTSRPPEPKTTKPTYDRAHLVVVNIRLWAARMNSEAMVTVRNMGSKPVVPCSVLRGAIIVSPWLSGMESENQLFTSRPEWQKGGKGQMNCDTDWNPGVEKTYSIRLDVDPTSARDNWISLGFGEKVWYVVSRLDYRDIDKGPALPTIENCVYFREQKPEWVMDRCFGHNDPTVNDQWTTGSGARKLEVLK